MTDVTIRPVPLSPDDRGGFDLFAGAARAVMDFDARIQDTLRYAETHLPGVPLSFGGDAGQALLVYAEHEGRAFVHAVTLPTLLGPLGQFKLQDVILDFQARLLPKTRWTDGRPR